MVTNKRLRELFTANYEHMIGNAPQSFSDAIKIENEMFYLIEKVCYKGRKIRLSSGKYVTVNRVNDYNVNCFQAGTSIGVWFDIDDLLK